MPRLGRLLVIAVYMSDSCHTCDWICSNRSLISLIYVIRVTVVYGKCGGFHVSSSGWFYRVPDDPFRQGTADLPCHSDNIYLVYILCISTAPWCPGSLPTAPRERDYRVHELSQHNGPSAYSAVVLSSRAVLPFF